MPVSSSPEFKGPQLVVALEQIAREMRESLGRVIADVSVAGLGPAALARQLGIHVLLASRTLRAVASASDFQTLLELPSPTGLSKFIDAAAPFATPISIQGANQAVDRLREIIRAYPGGRQALLSAVSGWTPEARPKREYAAKYGLHQGAADLVGLEVRTNIWVEIRLPDPTGRHDLIAALGRTIGLRRLRVGNPFLMYLCRSTPTVQTGVGQYRLDGKPITGAIEDVMMPEFCSVPAAPIKMDLRPDGTMTFVLDGDEPALNTDCTVAWGSLWHTPPTVKAPRLLGVDAFTCRMPSRRVVWDILVHRDLHDGCEPAIFARHQAITPDCTSVLDPAFSINLIDLGVRFRGLEQGLEGMALDDVPDHQHMIERAMELLEQNPGDYVAYRAECDFPPLFVKFECPWPFAAGHGDRPKTPR